ncbi:MAG TPA: hypothetical protein VIG99_20065 [Myxococcaceae bacterium]|jgi:hypothetical protein
MPARFLAIAAIALSGACASVRPMTQSDREKASREVMEKPSGTVLTEGEVSKLDLDRTFICENEAQVGSHIPRYQCRSLRRVERERAAARGFVFDPSGNTTASRGAIPAETSSPGTTAQDLMATNGNKVVKQDERPPAPSTRTAPAADQDPRFPPL